MHEQIEAPQPEIASTDAPSLLIVDYRDRVRSQLHTFFEHAGYNVIEAADRGEALALAQIHEGMLDLLVADAPDAAAIGSELKIKALSIVDEPETSENQIRRPFTQQMLLDRVNALVTPLVTSSA